jgi:class 3 adenylate cyclase
MADRKTVAALFAEIRGAIELMEDLEPEEARAIIDPALRGKVLRPPARAPCGSAVAV